MSSKSAKWTTTNGYVLDNEEPVYPQALMTPFATDPKTSQQQFKTAKAIPLTGVSSNRCYQGLIVQNSFKFYPGPDLEHHHCLQAVWYTRNGVGYEIQKFSNKFAIRKTVVLSHHWNYQADKKSRYLWLKEENLYRRYDKPTSRMLQKKRTRTSLKHWFRVYSPNSNN